VSNSESLDRLALPVGGDRLEKATTTTQAGIFALDVALSIVEAQTDKSTAARRLQYVAERCTYLTKDLAAQVGEA